MKQLNLFRNSLLALMLFSAGIVSAQTRHPLHYGIIGTATTTNWYQDYVGVRFEVLTPLIVAGDKQYSYAFSGTSSWGAPVTTPLINKQIVMPQAGDSLVGSAVTPGLMTGKIAFVYRGGGVYFSDKAARCFAAGAIAVVIVNNQSNGVIGMSASTPFTGCPVFMITKADGDAIDAAYHDGIAGDTARMTISLWGLGNTYDVGLINQGYSLYHNYAIPYSQLTSGINPVPYKGVNGAFIANFGTADPGQTTLYSTTTFYPVSGPSVTVHSDSTKLPSFPVADSIWSFYGPEFNMTGITSGDGHVTTRYSIKTATPDQYGGDDTLSTTFFLTDSLYSKGRYDFVKHHPIATFYESPALGTTPPDGDYFLWGPMYYIAKGGGYFDSVQFTAVSNTDTGHIISSISDISVFLFKWVDGANSDPLDSIVQTDELQLIGMATKSFPATDANPADTSGGWFAAQFGDSLGNHAAIHVDSNSWYFVAEQLENGWFMGLDGNTNSFPRTYGTFNYGKMEYPSTMWPGAEQAGVGAGPIVSYPGYGMSPATFGGTSLIRSIDSTIFSSQKGLIPAVAFTTSSYVPDTGATDTTHKHDLVHNVNKASVNFDIYPNPATDVINASLTMSDPGGVVTYTILNSSAQVVASEKHTNVMLNDKCSFTTNKLPNGTYYLAVVTNAKSMFKKFVVLR